MSLEVLSDVILDECVFLANAGGTRMRQNDRTSNQGGYVTVNAIRDVSLMQYALGVKPMGAAIEWQEVVAVYEVTDAGAFGFLIKDPVDQYVSDGGLQGYMLGAEFGVPGFGNGGPVYGLRKLYKPLSTSRTKARAITRPDGAPAITRGGTPVVVGSGAGNISFSSAPVYVTFVPDATRTITSVTVGATTEINIGTTIPVVINGRLWIQGMTGSGAALLNNKSHLVIGISGSTYTLAVDTTGATINVSGQALKYPQPDEALKWAGAFFVPVHFASDDMNWDLVRPGDFNERLVQGMSVTLMEIREA